MEPWIATALERESPLRLLRVQGSADAWLVSRLRDAHPGPILLISPGSKRAERQRQGRTKLQQRTTGYDVAVVTAK